jgi:hypothetical protein
MKYKAIVFSLAMITLFSYNVLASKKGSKSSGPENQSSISGVILDKTTYEKLAGVTIQLPGTDQKIYSDAKGEFKLQNITPGNYTVKINCISYKDKVVSVKIIKGENETVTILLNPIEP